MADGTSNQRVREILGAIADGIVKRVQKDDEEAERASLQATIENCLEDLAWAEYVLKGHEEAV